MIKDASGQGRAAKFATTTGGWRPWHQQDAYPHRSAPASDRMRPPPPRCQRPVPQRFRLLSRHPTRDPGFIRGSPVRVRVQGWESSHWLRKYSSPAPTGLLPMPGRWVIFQAGTIPMAEQWTPERAGTDAAPSPGQRSAGRPKNWLVTSGWDLPRLRWLHVSRLESA